MLSDDYSSNVPMSEDLLFASCSYEVMDESYFVVITLHVLEKQLNQINSEPFYNL